MSKKYGLPWCTEIADEKQYQTAKEYGCDAFWIGARTVSSPFAMANLAQAMFSETKPILIKNPISPDIKLWEGAIMRLQIQNCHNIGLIFRGYLIKMKLNETLAKTNGELKRLNVELGEKNEELKRLNEEVLELTHSRLVFFTNISHELRTLLSGGFISAV